MVEDGEIVWSLTEEREHNPPFAKGFFASCGSVLFLLLSSHFLHSSSLCMYACNFSIFFVSLFNFFFLEIIISNIITCWILIHSKIFLLFFFLCQKLGMMFPRILYSKCYLNTLYS